MKLKTITRPFEIKSVNDDGSFEGYATVFGNADFYGDIIMPGALTKTLARKRVTPVPALWQHDQDDPIGVYPELTVDNKGLLVKGMLTRGVQQADECYLLMKSKAISGLSMGFITEDADYNMTTGQRSILQLDLWEISPVTFPANDLARVTDVKSLSNMGKLSDIEQYLRDEGGFSAKEAKCIVSRIKALDTPRDADSAEIKKALSILRS